MRLNKLTAADAFGYKQRGRGWALLLNVANVSSLFPLPAFNCALRLALLIETVRHHRVSQGYVRAQIIRTICDGMASSYYLPALFLNLCVDSVASLMDQQGHPAQNHRRRAVP